MFRTDITPDSARFGNNHLLNEFVGVVDFQEELPGFRGKLRFERQIQGIFDELEPVKRFRERFGEQGRNIALTGQGRLDVGQHDEETVGFRVEGRELSEGRELLGALGVGPRGRLSREVNAVFVDRYVDAQRQEILADMLADFRKVRGDLRFLERLFEPVENLFDFLPEGPVLFGELHETHGRRFERERRGGQAGWQLRFRTPRNAQFEVVEERRVGRLNERDVVGRDLTRDDDDDRIAKL